jgi:hypothetical protein
LAAAVLALLEAELAAVVAPDEVPPATGAPLVTVLPPDEHAANTRTRPVSITPAVARAEWPRPGWRSRDSTGFFTPSR